MHKKLRNQFEIPSKNPFHRQIQYIFQSSALLTKARKDHFTKIEDAKSSIIFKKKNSDEHIRRY